MATTTFAVGTADTGNTPNTSGAFTPALNDLLVAFCIGSGQTNDSATLTSSVAGFTFSQVTGATTNYTASGHRMYMFVSDQLVSSATSQTVDFTPGGTANGSIIFVYRVSGMSRRGLIAVRQTKVIGSTTNGTPAVTFDASALTGNPTFAFIGTNTTTPVATPPTNWTENASGDITYANPTIGGEISARDSGFTGTTITWGASVTATYAAIIAELDTSAYTIDVGAGSGTFTGYAPTLSVAGGGTTISVGAGSGTFTGYAATTNPTVSVGAGSGTFTGYAATTNPKIDVGAGSGTFAGYAPTSVISDNLRALPAVGTGAFQGYAPDLVFFGTIIPAVGSGSFTGYAPTLSEAQEGGVSPPCGAGTFQGYAPTCKVEWIELPAGGPSKRRRREPKYHIEIDGQTFVGSYDEIAAILAQAKALAARVAEEAAQKAADDALRTARVVGKVAQVRVAAPVIKGEHDELSAAQRAIEQAYRDAQLAAEIQALMAFEAEMDDEDVLLLM